MNDVHTSREPFLVAYTAIRERLLSNHIRPGEQVKIAEIADELRLSATPVREALHHLSGEGLIDDRRRLGYFAPSLRGRTLAELYGLYRLLLQSALASALGPHLSAAAPPAAFEAILRASGNRTLFEAGTAIAARLAPYSAAEDRFIDTNAEAAEFLGAALDVGGLLDAYFARRQDLADAIATETEAPLYL